MPPNSSMKNWQNGSATCKPSCENLLDHRPGDLHQTLALASGPSLLGRVGAHNDDGGQITVFSKGCGTGSIQRQPRAGLQHY